VKKLVVAPGAKVKSQQNKEGGSALRKACPQVAWYIYFEQKKKVFHRDGELWFSSQSSGYMLPD
jgi:hypothetical protein